MNAQDLLQEISDYCRHTGRAEWTCGGGGVNDGKLTARLRNGGRITTDTLDRIRAFMAATRGASATRPTIIERQCEARPGPLPAPSAAPDGPRGPQRHFRFFDYRQTCLVFVN